jgi:hypothetical protein
MCMGVESDRAAALCRFKPQRIPGLCRGEIDVHALEAEPMEADDVTGVPAWESYAVVPGMDEPQDIMKRARLG